MAAAASRKKPAPMGARMQAQAEQAAELLKALSNPQRLRVMCLLIDGERTVGEINAEVELSQSALSQHLAVLRDGGWVQTRRESQNVYYSVTEGPVHKLIETLHDIYCPAPGKSDRDGLC
ncbi:MAG: metalloregulator ArsR/SmtB family transcription factor [Lysobacteraceae bacterium]|jgi:ArsR family transcriptional regulator, virulence genes transcriptional regulator